MIWKQGDNTLYKFRMTNDMHAWPIIHFTVLQALESQFPVEEGYKLARCDRFNFKREMPDEDLYLQLTVKEHDSYQIGLEPSSARV